MSRMPSRKNRRDGFAAGAVVDVRYEGVTFRFADSAQGVFDITLHAAPGETVALVGPTDRQDDDACPYCSDCGDPKADVCWSMVTILRM